MGNVGSAENETFALLKDSGLSPACEASIGAQTGRGEREKATRFVWSLAYARTHTLVHTHTHTHRPTREKHEFNSSFYIIYQPRQKRDLSTLNHPNFCNSLDNIVASGFPIQGRIECLSRGIASWYKGICFLIDWESTSDISEVPRGPKQRAGTTKCCPEKDSLCVLRSDS